MTPANTRFMTAADWQPFSIEPHRYGNNAHRLKGYVRADGTGGKPLYPAAGTGFEDKLRQTHTKTRDRFKGLGIWRFHVQMPFLTGGQRQPNPVYRFLKAPLRLSSTSITVLLLPRALITTADMGFYYNGKILPTLQQRMRGKEFTGLIANLGYYMTEGLIADGYPWSHNTRYPQFPIPDMPSYLGFYYFQQPDSEQVLSTFQGTHPAAVGIKRSGEIKILSRLEIDHYRVTLGGETLHIKSINSSDPSADVIAFTPDISLPPGTPGFDKRRHFAPEIPVSGRINLFIANEGAAGDAPIERVVKIWPDRAPLPSYGAVLSFDRDYFKKRFGDSALQSLPGQRVGVTPCGNTDFGAYRQIMGGLVPAVLDGKRLYLGGTREKIVQDLERHGNATSPLGRCAKESANFDLVIREPSGVFFETQDNIGWILFDGRHELTIGANVIDSAHILAMLEDQNVIAQSIQNAVFIDGGSGMKVYAARYDGKSVRLDLTNRVAAGSRNGPGEDRDGLNLYSTIACSVL